MSVGCFSDGYFNGIVFSSDVGVSEICYVAVCSSTLLLAVTYLIL